MPVLVRLYIRSCLIGFGLAGIFVAALIRLDVAHLGHLLSTSEAGLVATLALWVLNGIVFAGVQFGWAIMQLGRKAPPRGGRRAALPGAVRVPAASRPSR